MEIIHTRNSRKLAQAMATIMRLTLYPGNVRRFSNDEISVSLRKSFREVIVVACTQDHDDWIELLLLLDALRGASKVILCMSYMGYSRQDQQIPNESFAAGMFAKILETMNISNLVIVDNHSEPLARIPTQHISAKSIFEKDILSKYRSDQIIVVSPDLGGVRRAYEISKSLNCSFIICNKSKNVFGELKKINPIGSVDGKVCVLIDDMIDSGATLCHASESLLRAGSRAVVAYCTHGVLSRGSVERLEKSDITEIVLTDSIFRDDFLPSKFRKLSIDSLVVDAIRSIV
jgi:ribose-phosphate pyrophosphokinase